MANDTKWHALKAALAVAGLFAAQAVSANPLILSDGDTIKLSPGTYQSGNGGEFLWTGVTIANASSGSFISFCVEENENVSWGGTYKVTLNTDAVKGGGVIGNGGTFDVNGTPGVSDPLSNATAWLYTQYLTNPGALTGFSYSVANAGAIQNAIWYLEDEGSLPSGNATTWANQAIAAANGHWTNPGNVYVLNLSSPDQRYNQDQLYLMPVPEPETYAMMLAGLGLMGFVARRRKRNVAA